MLKFLNSPDKPPDSDSEQTPSEGSVADEVQVDPDETGEDAFDSQKLLNSFNSGLSSDPDSMLRRKIQSLEQRISYLERIVKVSQMLNSTLSLEPLLQVIVQSATELTNTEVSSIMLIDQKTGELRFAESTGGVSDALRQVTVPMDNSIGGWVIRQDKPLLIRDVKMDSRWHKEVDQTVDFETRSILGVPLKVRSKVIGVLEVINKLSDDGFSEDDVQITTTLAAQAAIAIENARLLDELQQAYRDLSEVDQLKNDFVSIASHELRTPLAVILGYATFLQDDVSGQASEQLEIVP